MPSQRCRRSLASELRSADGKLTRSPRSSKRKKPESPSPQKRMSKVAKHDDEEVNSVKTKSFYGKHTSKYLNPLERKSVSTDDEISKVTKPAPLRTTVANNKPARNPVKKPAARKKPPLTIIKTPSRDKPATRSQTSDVGTKENIVKSPDKSPDKSKRFFKTRTSPRKRSLSPGIGKSSVTIHKSKGFNMKFQANGKLNTRRSKVAHTLVTKSSMPKSLGEHTESPRPSSRASSRSSTPDPVGVSRQTLKRKQLVNSASRDSSLSFEHKQDLFDAFDVPEATSPPIDESGFERNASCPPSPGLSSNGDSVNLVPEFLLNDPCDNCEPTIDTQASSVNEVPPSPAAEQQKKYYPIFQRSPQSTPKSNSKLAKDKVPSTPSSSSASASKRKSLKRIVTKDMDGKEQMILDCGQKVFGAVQCPTCGMTYTHADPTDEATHTRFHQNVISVLKFPGWKRERIMQDFYDGSRIICIMPDDKIGMKKFAAVKKIVDDDLGFVVEGSALKPQSKVFFYISSEKRISGVCIAESITQGYRVVPDAPVTSSQGSIRDAQRPWCCDTVPVRAKCGINRIWVLSTERRVGIATKLIDAVRKHFLMGYMLEKSDLAFSDPTPDGKSFAAKYTNDPRFLVYKHSAC